MQRAKPCWTVSLHFYIMAAAALLSSTPATCTSFDCYKYQEDTPLQLAQLTMNVLHAMSLDNDFKLPVIHNRDDCSRWLKMIESVQLYGWVELRGIWTYMEVKVPLVKHIIAAYAAPHRDFPLGTYDPIPCSVEGRHNRCHHQRSRKLWDVSYAPCASVVDILIYIRPVMPFMVLTRFFMLNNGKDTSFITAYPGERGASDALRSQITRTGAGLDDYIACVLQRGLPCVHRDTRDLPFPVHAAVDIIVERHDENENDNNHDIIIFAGYTDSCKSRVPTTISGRGRAVQRLPILEQTLVTATGMPEVVTFHAAAPGMPTMVAF